MVVSARICDRCRKDTCVYGPSAIAAGTTAGRQNRGAEQSPQAHAICHSFVFAGLTDCRRDCSSEARRCEPKRDFSRQKYSCETETLDENSRLVCNTAWGIQAVALTQAVLEDTQVYPKVAAGHYQIVFASPEGTLARDGPRWSLLTKKDSSIKKLLFVAVDQVHLVLDGAESF
jgi:hypothetical protein